MTFFKCHYFHQIFNVDTFKVSSLMFIIFWCFIKRHCWLIYIDTLKSVIIDLPMLTLTLAPRNVQNIICLFWHSKKCHLMWIIILKIPLLKWYILCPIIYNFGCMIFYKVQNNNFNINNYIFQKKLNKFGNNIMIKN